MIPKEPAFEEYLTNWQLTDETG